jgi:DNA-binding Lrp family transcriptional regulator
MSRGRKLSKDISYRDKKIVERYNSALDTMPSLAKKYSISKQRIHEILKRAKRLGYVINKQNLSKRYHDIHQCEICKKILKIAQKDELMTKSELTQILNIDIEICNWHLDRLKGSGFISKKFATIRSDRLVKALRCYKYDFLSPATIGKKFGYKNFYSILSYQNKKGINLERIFKLPTVPELKQKEQMAISPSMSHIEF